jgi:glycosyltransferase involved in cell wall biosynthesis
VRIELYPLLREREAVVHPEATSFVERAHYLPFLSLAIIRSQAVLLLRRPRRYLGALGALLRGTWGSANFFFGGLGIFPKAAHAARLMEAGGVDHVHCHFATHPALAGLIINRLTGIPFSFTAHGSDLHVDRHMLRQKVDAAAFVVPISEFNARMIVEECGDVSAKLEVIHCGVDTGMFTTRTRPAAVGPLRILAVGTLHEVKGQAYLIEACRQLRVAGVDLRCQLVGDGPDERELRRQASAAGLDGRVEFIGRLTQTEIASLLREVHVLVAPSVPTRSGKREGIPVVLIEAMSSAVPVVASAISGIPELVEHEVSGLLVPERDSSALANALTRLHRDPALAARLAEGGREKVRREFDVHISASRLAACFAHAVDTAKVATWR